MASKNSVCPPKARKLSNGACFNTETRKIVSPLAKNASANASRNAAKNAAPKKAKSKKSAAKRKDSLSVSCGCTPARPKLSTGKKRKSKKAGK